MRVLAACSLGGAGHLRPLVPFLDAARASGHETMVTGPPSLAGLVADTRHPFSPGGEPPESAVGPIREQLTRVPPAEASILGNRELFGRVATSAMLPSIADLLTRWQPDLVLRDPCEYASAVVGGARRIPTAQVAIGLAEVEWGSISVASPALEAHRRGLADELRRSPYATRFPGALDASPFPDTRRFWEVPAAAGGALPDWWPGSSEPLVYMSFGTVLGYMTIAGAVYRAALQAVAGLEARVLLTVGHRFEPSALGEPPGNVHVEPWFDQADVLAHAAVVVCHGGSGTTFGALAAGVPVVIVPLFADQFVNGQRVVDAGAGLVVDTGRDDRGRPRQLGADDAPRIREAIATALHDSSYRRAAETIAGEMRGAPSLAATLAGLLDCDSSDDSLR